MTDDGLREKGKILGFTYSEGGGCLLQMADLRHYMWVFTSKVQKVISFSSLGGTL